MRVNFETRLKIFFILIIIGIIGIAVFTNHYYQSVKHANSAFFHSNQLHSLSQALLIDVQDLEVTSTAYALSADSSHIPRYQLARTSMFITSASSQDVHGSMLKSKVGSAPYRY